MNVLYFIAGLALIILIYMWFEAGWVKAETEDFGSGLVIAHLSDIHIDRLRVNPEKIIKILEDKSPDIVVMTGDYIEKKQDTGKFLKFLEAIAVRYPAYLTLGNHDHRAFSYDNKSIQEFISQMETAGAVVLQNKSVLYKKNGRKYLLTGIDDLREGKPVFNAFTDIVENADYHVILTHNPDTILYLPEGCADYMLSGHFHGGQIWAPWDLEFKLLRKDILCKRGITRGLHKINGINLYINRGLGNVIVPFRLFSRPEIAFIKLP